MRLGGLRSAAVEARELRSAFDDVRPESAGAVVVGGMLAEQLVRELGRGAAPGAVRLAAERALRSGDVAVHVFAGEPDETVLERVSSADGLDVPVVLVQLWPQEDWTAPYVLSPFVVECAPGAGFPVGDIAAAIVEAVGVESRLPERVPVLRDALERRAVWQTVARAAIIGLVTSRARSVRPLLTLEQARLLVRLDPVPESAAPADPRAVQAGSLAALGAWGLLLRGVARRARRVLPPRIVDPALAAGGTWAVAAAARIVRARLARDAH